MAEQEIWKDIIGYEGIYQISNFGRIKSLDRINCVGHKLHGKIKKAVADKDGYLQVRLSINGLTKTYKVHRLVATAFIDNPLNFPQINHKDENKVNNTANNIEWCDCKYNLNYGTARDRIKHHIDYLEIGRKRSKAVLQIGPNGKVVKLWRSGVEASKSLNIDLSTLYNCCNGKRKTAGGYKWKYVEEGE